MFRTKADRIIDEAHNAICDAEILVDHACTDEDKAHALDQLADAQRYLARAVEAKRAWYASAHGDYDEYPDVPRHAQINLL